MPTGKSLELHPLFHGAVLLWSKACTVPGGRDCHFPNSVLREHPEKWRRFPRGCVLTAENGQHPCTGSSSSVHTENSPQVLPLQTRIHQRRGEKNQSLKMLTNSIGFGIGMILFLFSFCLSSLNFPFDSL